MVFLCTNGQTGAHGRVNRLREMIDFMHIENNLLLQLNKNITNEIDLWTSQTYMQLLPLFERMKVFINTCLANLNSEKELNFYKKKILILRIIEIVYQQENHQISFHLTSPLPLQVL